MQRWMGQNTITNGSLPPSLPHSPRKMKLWPSYQKNLGDGLYFVIIKVESWHFIASDWCFLHPQLLLLAMRRREDPGFSYGADGLLKHKGPLARESHEADGP